MLLVLIAVPLMVLAVAVATVPIVIAMRKEAAEQRQALRPVGRVVVAPAEEVPLAA